MTSTPRHPLALTDEEARAYREDGFFAREAVFSSEELEGLRSAAERVAEHAQRAADSGRAYDIDGNRYVETEDATVQFEHETTSL